MLQIITINGMKGNEEEVREHLKGLDERCEM